MDFKTFDRRNYPTVPARTGYGEWAATYEEAVPNQLDIRVLESLRSIVWSRAENCLDLACGTGRTGEWLKARGVVTIDGIDLTPEMLEHARAKEIYRSLFLGSVEETGISHACYDLIIMSLVDEHLASLERVYQEAYRLSNPRAKFVVVSGRSSETAQSTMATSGSDVTALAAAINLAHKGPKDGESKRTFHNEEAAADLWFDMYCGMLLS
jgi:predicted TPR repeat methyltransferase